jgi:hypothetical protein
VVITMSVMTSFTYPSIYGLLQSFNIYKYFYVI